MNCTVIKEMLDIQIVDGNELEAIPLKSAP